MANLKRFHFSASSDSFWQSVNILLTKPHVINKRLWGNKILFNFICKPLNSSWKIPLDCSKLQSIENVQQYTTDCLLKELHLQQCDKIHTDDRVEVIIIELLPKNYVENHAYQLVCLNKIDVMATFYDITPETLQQKLCPSFSYTLFHENDEVVLKCDYDIESKTYHWLIETVLPQFVKWGENRVEKQDKQNIFNKTLALVSNDKYYQKYNKLKLKYGKEMVKIWPECTDPVKFVYEDVAIATYLLLLWEDERLHHKRNNLQTFVDLGCGNGLLVYILTKEGHQGVGIDVRKRNIWGIYPSDVKLEEKTLTPSDADLFPETNWIIGNHSDELTPWIPVIAARSSYCCNFFLLPCCSYNFDGSKYQRQNSSKSQYMEYLEYIKQLCENCGFKTDSDRLKIPSTKRVCFVGRGRNYTEEEYNGYCNNIQNLITSETSNAIENKDRTTSWIKDFKPRDPIERVRNCTQIDKTLIETIINCITKYLLDGCILTSEWSAGKTAQINQLVQLIPPDKLKELKSECGGLQTLLKNNHHIFKVQSGIVQLRHPKTIEEVNCDKKNKAANIKIKQKPCWFYNNHPYGCPLMDKECSFLHVKSS